jgi:hypothetical protein
MQEENGVEKYRPIQRLLDHVRNADYGHLFPYDELRAIIRKDAQGSGRSIIHRARKKLLREKQKLLLALDGQGYYIAHPDEHVTFAETMSESGDRKKIKALEATIYVDISGMNAESIKKLADQQLRLRLEIVTRRKISSSTTVRDSLKLPTGEELLGIITKKKKT